MKRLFLKFWLNLFPNKINSKQYIEESMRSRWGEDWLEMCLKGLESHEVRANLRADLGLTIKY